MKKSKIIILSAALLVAVMVLSSCSLPIQIPFGAIDMAQLIDKTQYVDDNVIYTSVEEIEDLEKATFVSSSGNLALFATEDKKGNTEYIVYNYATGATTSFTEGEKVNMLEINTTPGMTATSFIPQQVRAAGLDIKDVMTDIIENKFN